VAFWSDERVASNVLATLTAFAVAEDFFAFEEAFAFAFATRVAVEADVLVPPLPPTSEMKPAATTARRRIDTRSRFDLFVNDIPCLL
jgi:hypothetical protein